MDGWKKMFPFGGVLSFQVLRHVSFKVSSNTQIYWKSQKTASTPIRQQPPTGAWGDRYIAPPDPDVPSRMAPNTEEAGLMWGGFWGMFWGIQMRDMVWLV